MPRGHQFSRRNSQTQGRVAHGRGDDPIAHPLLYYLDGPVRDDEARAAWATQPHGGPVPDPLEGNMGNGPTVEMRPA